MSANKIETMLAKWEEVVGEIYHSADSSLDSSQCEVFWNAARAVEEAIEFKKRLHNIKSEPNYASHLYDG